MNTTEITQTLTTQTLIDNVIAWAKARGIIEHGTLESQVLKALSEVGEMADAYVKRDAAAVIDAVGDVIVCLICAAQIAGGSWPEVLRETLWQLDSEEHVPREELRDAMNGMAPGEVIRALACFVSTPSLTKAPESVEALMHLVSAVAGLAMLAEHVSSNTHDCLLAAWNEIKDRKGHMSAGGVFVKEVSDA